MRRFLKVYFFLVAICVFGLIGCDSGSDRKIEKTEGAEEALETQQISAFDHDDSARIDSFFADLYSKNQFNGNVLFYKSGKRFEKSYGLADFSTQEPLTLEHKFQLASVSKPFTAVATMIMVQKELIRLEDTLQFYFPDFPYPNITVEMLMTHRSGLGNYMYITDDIWENKEMQMCNENVLDSMISLSPDAYYPPNYKFNYCNTNYFLLAAVLEKVTGMSFESIMQKYVFDPAGLNNTLVYSGMDYMSIEKVAVGHNASGRVKPDFYLNGVTGDKGVFSTVGDLFKFDRSLAKGDLSTNDFQDKMYLPGSDFDRDNKSYALGWRIKRLENFDVIYHKGWWRGYRSYFLRVPDKDIVIAVLCNSTSGGFLSVEELMELIGEG